jgi:hypothetical protein
MNEKPILFSGPMIKAILEGRKRMTRRVAKVDSFGNLQLRSGWSIQADCSLQDVKQERLPWHHGMRLWVREVCWMWGQWGHNGRTPTGLVKWRFHPIGKQVLYDRPEGELARRGGEPGWVYRHARFMPRWASRITLELTGVRVERVQDISTADVEAEGFDVASKLPPVVPPGTNVEMLAWMVAQDLFAKTWDKLNGKRGFPWESNPWVWVLEFKRVD